MADGARHRRAVFDAGKANVEALADDGEVTLDAAAPEGLDAMHSRPLT